MQMDGGDDVGAPGSRASKVRSILKEMQAPPPAERRRTKPIQGPNEPDDVFQQRMKEWEAEQEFQPAQDAAPIAGTN